MNKLAILGPPGTFCDIAAQEFLDSNSGILNISDVRYFRTIKKVFNAVGDDCNYGVLPTENLSEGYLQVVLDLLVQGNLTIIREILLPINFTFVSKSTNLKEVEKVFVQYVAEGQCTGFLETLNNVQIVKTESNLASLESMLEDDGHSGAIIPSHAAENLRVSLVIKDVHDYKNNVTRFIVLARSGEVGYEDPDITSKTSLIVINDNDYPGFLVDVLSSFSRKGINLISIISRPTKEAMGKYHFFIDIEGHRKNKIVREALDEIARLNRVKILGSYPVGKQKKIR